MRLDRRRALGRPDLQRRLGVGAAIVLGVDLSLLGRRSAHPARAARACRVAVAHRWRRRSAGFGAVVYNIHAGQPAPGDHAGAPAGPDERGDALHRLGDDPARRARSAARSPRRSGLRTALCGRRASAALTRSSPSLLSPVRSIRADACGRWRSSRRRRPSSRAARSAGAARRPRRGRRLARYLPHMPELPEMEAWRRQLERPGLGVPDREGGAGAHRDAEDVRPAARRARGTALPRRRAARQAAPLPDRRRRARPARPPDDGRAAQVPRRPARRARRRRRSRSSSQGGAKLVLTENARKKRAGVWLLTPEAAEAELAHLGPEALGLGAERLGEIVHARVAPAARAAARPAR